VSAARVAAALWLFVAGSAGAAQPLDCTQFPVQDVLVNAPPADALNVLILGDGFEANELDTYRRAACLLVEGVLKEQPFANFACRLNFYRIDSVSSYDDIEVRCGTDYARTWTAAGASTCTAASDTGPPPASVVTLDLNTKVCPSVMPVSRVVLPDYTGAESPMSPPLGETRALQLATVCAASKNIHVVVVLSDTATPAAAAKRLNAPKLVVTTLAAIEFDPSRHYRLTHELGHTLTLLDEYADKDWENDDYHEGRNLWRPCDKTNAAVSPFEASWADYCDPWLPLSEDPEVLGCNGGLVASPCRLGLCGPAKCTEPCGSRALVLLPVGLYEGGFYEECGTFRSQQYCRMEDNLDEPFCIACLCTAKSFLVNDVGLAECASPSVCAAPDLLIRDCLGDDGSVPSNCVPPNVASPDIVVRGAMDPDSPVGAFIDVLTCVTNTGDPIPSGELSALVTIELELLASPVMAQHQVALPIDTLFPDHGPPTSQPWGTGERRCFKVSERVAGVPPGALLTPLVTATVWMPGDGPRPGADPLDDGNRASKQVAISPEH
jgi:hypothetical protein